MSGLLGDLSPHFSRFLGSRPGRLHVAAHSHHPWPDVTFDAQQQAWLQAADAQDDKWEVVFTDLLPAVQQAIARRVALPDPTTIAVAPNTHDLLRRILSCLPRPARALTTDAEFHSFRRQAARLVEAGDLHLDVVAADPLPTLPARLAAAAARGGHDLVFVSHVLFDSGFVLPDLAALVAAVPDRETLVVVDGYHAFMALPVDLSALADRIFYLAGGYKYAMAGEGVCWLHAPPGYGPRPVDTGWFAEFGALAAPPAPGQVAYPTDGARFLGATFDVTPLHRFLAVQRLLDELGIDVPAIHAHVRALQAAFLDRVDALGVQWVSSRRLVPDVATPDRGHFLTFATPDAGEAVARLRTVDVVADSRGDRLRIGFGIHHRPEDVDELCRRIAAVA